MKHKSSDPLGHITLSASDFAKSREFYAKLFAYLGYQTITDDSHSTGWASPDGLGFWLKEAEAHHHPYAFGAPGLHHVCFKAKSRADVDRLHRELLLVNNIKIFDAPAAYPQYTADYYAVFFADPDGVKLEYAFYT